MKTTWITQRWATGVPERDAELSHCAEVNRMLFGEGYIAIGYQDARTTFGDLMQRCGAGLNIIANSDIYTGSHALSLMTDYFSKPGHAKACMALSRWDVAADGLSCTHHAHRDSQDVWAFVGRPTRKLIDAAREVPMGVPGCDNRLCAIFAEHGYTLINPSRTVRMFHSHTSGYRTYGTGRGGKKVERVPGPYKFVTPTTL